MRDSAPRSRLWRRWRDFLLLLGVIVVVVAIGLLFHSLRPLRQEIADMSPTRIVASLVRSLGVMLGVAAAPPAIGQNLPPPPPTQIGINLASPEWYQNERSFANLAMGGHWQVAGPGPGWPEMPAQHIGPNGSLLSLPPQSAATRMLVRPNTGPSGSSFRCTYQGRGSMVVFGAATQPVAGRGEVRFRWTNNWEGTAWLQVWSTDAKDPIRAIDCRETTMPREVRFDPGFVRSITGYKVLRFMDWERTNANEPVTWATRNTPASIDVARGAGVAIEDMVALSVATGAAPWFTVPWNADADYIERFARLVHDTLPADRQVYVELGNEVWNGQFPVTQQAATEGAQRRLSPNPHFAMLSRYGERTVEVMRIWERVFGDRPSRLVRIVSTQHVLPNTAEVVLGFRDVAAHVDALATAPYFGFDVMNRGATSDLGELFRRLDVSIAQTIDLAVANRAVAAKYRKRYLAYEAGQHVVIPGDVALNVRLQRDPRMYDAYKKYIAAWRARVGDTLMLFGTVGPIGPGGAWGLAEHSGQSPAEAPKLRAALEERAH